MRFWTADDAIAVTDALARNPSDVAYITDVLERAGGSWELIAERARASLSEMQHDATEMEAELSFAAFVAGYLAAVRLTVPFED